MRDFGDCGAQNPDFGTFDRTLAPLVAPEPDARTLIQWSAPWCDLIEEIPLPPALRDRTFGAHEGPGYLIVLKRVR